jgi:hypothetical protein
MGSLPADLPLTGMLSDLKREIHVGGTHGAFFFSLCADEDRVRGTNDRRMPGRVHMQWLTARKLRPAVIKSSDGRAAQIRACACCDLLVVVVVVDEFDEGFAWRRTSRSFRGRDRRL